MNLLLGPAAAQPTVFFFFFFFFVVLWQDPDSGLFPPQPASANPDGSGFALLDPTATDGIFCQTWSPDAARVLCYFDNGLLTAGSTDLSSQVDVTGSLPNGLDNAANGYDAYGWSPVGSRRSAWPGTARRLASALPTCAGCESSPGSFM